jgi:hypothetical protein
MRSWSVYGLLPLGLLLLLAVSVASPAFTQTPTDESVEEEFVEDPELLAPETDDVSPEEGLSEIDALLGGDDEVLAGGGYTYDPGDRRDPFVNPFRRRALTPSGPRPEGKAGLLIEEISVTGIFTTPQGILAQVRAGSTDKSYLLQAGDQLFDGDVVRVEVNEVVFNQIDTSSTAAKPFREVVRRLSEKKN